MSYKTDVILLAAEMELGETIRCVCPRCNGGSSQEKSLTITLGEDGSLVWNCFRAKCDESGATGNKTDIPRSTKKSEKPVKRFSGETVPLSEERLRLIEAKWGITDPPYWYWTPSYGGRVAMSIRSPKFMHRGWCLRDMRGVARAKALTYIDPGEEAISWYKTSPSAPTVLVEDIPSAVRASTYMNAASLLGTGIGQDKAIEIATYSTRPVILALDNDATDLSFKWARKYGLLWDDVIVLPLKKDLKDMTEQQLKELLT